MELMSQEEALGNELKAMEKTESEAPVLRMVLSQPFILLYVMNTMSLISGIFAVNNFKSYGQANDITDEKFLAWVGSVAAIMNSIRFVWSAATDHFTYKSVYAILICM